MLGMETFALRIARRIIRSGVVVVACVETVQLPVQYSAQLVHPGDGVEQCTEDGRLHHCTRARHEPNLGPDGAKQCHKEQRCAVSHEAQDKGQYEARPKVAIVALDLPHETMQITGDSSCSPHPCHWP